MKTLAIQIPDDADENAVILAAERAVSPDWIASWWHIDDVRECADDDAQPSDDCCREVLRLAQRYHDAEQGINWDILRHWLDEVSETETV
jgi:hypothetical protein